MDSATPKPTRFVTPRDCYQWPETRAFFTRLGLDGHATQKITLHFDFQNNAPVRVEHEYWGLDNQ